MDPIQLVMPMLQPLTDLLIRRRSGAPCRSCHDEDLAGIDWTKSERSSLAEAMQLRRPLAHLAMMR